MAVVTLHIRQAWWLRYYLMGLVLMHRLTGMEPNWERINYWMHKGVKIKASKREGWDGA